MANQKKTSLLDELKRLLKKDKRFTADKQLLKNTIVEHALKLDKNLLKLLLSKKRTKERFFANVDGILVFDKDKFIAFVDNKQFLPDSYTAFKNKIGLTLDGKDDYLKERKDVCLVWPYKDCVLEGGQTKEDQKRDEIFWNETLAPDEIDRLFEPKVLTNFKRFDKDGEQRVSEIKDTDNLIIKGNNLLALHSLKKKIAGKIKLIYIDPPYNRDEDKNTFYNDSFNHSTWLVFMKNRLEVAKYLLNKEGVIFISIDDNEQAYLKVLCDEIFTREGFLANIAYERSGVSGLGQGGSFLVNTYESILCYKNGEKSITTFNMEGQSKFVKEEMKRYNKILRRVGNGKEVKRFIAPSTNEEVVIYKHENYEIETISLRNFVEREGVIRKQYLDNFEQVFRNTSIQEENEFQNRILSICKDGLYSAKYLVSRGKYKGKRITAYYLNGQVFVWLKESAAIVDGCFPSAEMAQINALG